MASSQHDRFIVHVPVRVVNEGGYIESANEMKAICLKRQPSRNNDTLMSSDDAVASPTAAEEGSSNANEMEDLDFQVMLDGILKRDLGVKTTYWTVMSDQQKAQVQFCVSNVKTEFILNNLLSLGIGDRFGSVWVHQLDVCRPHGAEDKNLTQMPRDQQFAESIKSRIIVEKVVEAARASAAFSFDYLMLVVVASILALLGLAYNNVVVIVASMLVSPIMGPVVAVTFGTIIKDWSLVKMGLGSESISLAICVLTGFLLGLVMVPFTETLDWPTEEMNSRGEIMGLVSGILVAIPSGIGVALSILGNNTSSLVGVAISASLLPPAVNTGILLAVEWF